MNFSNRNRAFTNRAFTALMGLLGAGALTALIGLPVAAQSSTQNTNPATTPSRTPTDPAFGNPNIVNPGSGSSSSDGTMTSPMRGQSDQMDQAETQDGPSAVGEGMPGASESPSGSPSVPGNSSVDDPGQSRSGQSSRSSTPERDALNNSTLRRSDSMNDSMQEGPSAVPGETFPGPSETPSGSPSIPGNSQVDSPGANQTR